jgi:RNAse (barnase) inhibitor barstar
MASAPDLVVRTVRGNKITTAERLFDEFAAALQFPDYFGENWDALDECLADLSWLPGTGYVIVVRDAIEVLSKEHSQSLLTLVNVLDRAAEEWNVAIELGEPWDRPAKSFHVILHADSQYEAKLLTLMQSAGRALPSVRHDIS